MSNSPVSPIIIGVVFALLWASGATATKFGLRSAEPLVLTLVRLLLAGSVLLLYCHGIKRYAFPKRSDWWKLAVMGILGNTAYLGLYVFGVSHVSAGLTGLFVAMNPFFITLASALLLKRTVQRQEWLGMTIAAAGLIVTTIPALHSSYADVQGTIFLLLSMGAFSASSVFMNHVRLELNATTLNAWQVSIGGLCLLPLTLLANNVGTTRFDAVFVASVAWLAFPMSIGAVQLWFTLLRRDPVHASTWLFLAPVLGYGYAAVFLGEVITAYTVLGTVLVIVGLFISKR